MSDDEPDVPTEPNAEIPLDGDVLQYTVATASLRPRQLAPLLRTVQASLGPQLETYRRAYEQISADADREVFLVPDTHWAEVGNDLDLSEQEIDALRRAHAQQLRRLGTKSGRREEFETALEIREAVVIGRHVSDPEAS